MNMPPEIVDGAKVVLFTKNDERHIHTGNCKQIVSGELMGSVAALAICQYEDEENYYLFGCNENWNTLTDSWHETLENAKEQAEFEYEGVTNTWQSL